MASGEGAGHDEETLHRPTDRRRWGWIVFALLLAAAVTLVATEGYWGPTPVPGERVVRLGSSQVLLNVSDIPEPNWGAWSAGANGTGAWRFFSVHTEIILATLNVTLWVEPDAGTAGEAMAAIAQNVSYATQDGAVPGSDASLSWFFNVGAYGGMVVRRYNVVFLLAAHLESSWSLTPSDLAKWAGWQLSKIESASVPLTVI